MRVEPSGGSQLGDANAGGTPLSAARSTATNGSPAARQGLGSSQVPFSTPGSAAPGASPAPTSPAAAAAAEEGGPAAAVAPTALEKAFAAAAGCDVASEAVADDSKDQGPVPPAAPTKSGAARAAKGGSAPADEAAAAPAALVAALLAPGPVAVAEVLAVLASVRPGGTTSSSGGRGSCDLMSGLGGSDAGARAVMGACFAAATRCVDEVERRRVRLRELEGRLVQLLAELPEQQQQQQQQQQSPGRVAGSGGSVEAGAAGRLRDSALLLCGAMLHTHIRSPFHERAVWNADGADFDAEAGDEGGLPPGLQSFVQLPAQMMKVVRGGCGLFVLKQLRLWLQDATLGDSWAMNEH
jgi:hypothetical protein